MNNNENLETKLVRPKDMKNPSFAQMEDEIAKNYGLGYVLDTYKVTMSLINCIKDNDKRLEQTNYVNAVLDNYKNSKL